MMATENQGPTIIGVTAFFWALALIVISLRFWSLQIRKRQVCAHDLLILLGFVSCSAFQCESQVRSTKL